MAAKDKSSASVEVSGAARGLGTQFRGLDFRDMSSWPSIPKYLLYLLVAAAVALALWYFVVRSYGDQYQAELDKEDKLRAEYKTKVQRAASLDLLKAQRTQVQQYVNTLEKQLPSKSEMDALLSDINQAGLGRSLQFELFKPSTPVERDYYMEQPIALKVTGRFHDIGAFTADVAALSRIVTLNNIAISELPANSSRDKSAVQGALVMEATAKTFRYLDEQERADQQAAKGKKNPRGGQK